jgi:hypothetical protein
VKKFSFDRARQQKRWHYGRAVSGTEIRTGALAKVEEWTRSKIHPRRVFLLALWIQILWRLGRSCRPGACKNPPRGGRKTVPRQMSRLLCYEGEYINRSENEASLVAAGLSRWAVARVAVAPWPGSPQRHRRLSGMASTVVYALRRLTAMISSRCLTRRVKARGPRQRKA